LKSIYRVEPSWIPIGWFKKIKRYVKEFHVPGGTVGIRHENETFIERASPASPSPFRFEKLSI
jgi:hypothetical protein